MQKAISQLILLLTVCAGFACSEPAQTQSVGVKTNTKESAPVGATSGSSTGVGNVEGSKNPQVPGEPPVVQLPSGPIEVPNFNFTGGIDTKNTFTRYGEIVGWAVDKDDLDAYLDVNVYFDGDNKNGTKVGSTKANLVGVDDNNGSEHAFIFYVPESNKDNKPHKIWIYALLNGVEIPVSKELPVTMTFYKRKGGAAKTFYNSIGFESKCTGCHRFTYETLWDRLLSPNMDGKWSETENTLYSKQKNHGVAICTRISCDKIRQWWRMEFGEDY